MEPTKVIKVTPCPCDDVRCPCGCGNRYYGICQRVSCSKCKEDQSKLKSS